MGMEYFTSWFVNFPAFLVTWLTFSVAAVLSFLCVAIANRKSFLFIEFLNHCFPFESWRKKSALMDVKLYIIGKFTDKIYSGLLPLCTSLVAALIGVGLTSILPQHFTIQPNYIIIAICSLLLLIIVELSNYLTHYMQHFVPALWEIHKVHHSATFLNPLTARRGHPLGFVFDGTASAVLVGIPAGLFHVFLNFSLIDILFLYTCASKLGTVVTLDALKHSQFPIRFGRLERIFISPYMHQIHHSTKVEHLDKNFGVNLSVWDWIFGTAVSPDKYEKIVYGFGSETEEDYERLWGVYAGPFLKIWHLVVGERHSELGAEPRAPYRRSIGEGVLWRKSDASNTARDERPLAAD